MLYLLPWLWLYGQPSHAWESDQLTRRDQPLDDITEMANHEVNAALDRAAEAASRRLTERTPLQRTHKVLARAVHKELATHVPVRGRGFVRSLGYGRYAAWLETADVARLAFPHREDLFAHTRFVWAPVLATGGTCSTFLIHGVRTGSDKTDHFFGTGWRYFRRSGAEDPERGIRWGSTTERTFLGWQTSSAFSRGDLYANWQGWQFYAQLLDPDRGLFSVQDGAVTRVGAFDWAMWVDAHWDELLYPSTYRPKVRAYLHDRLVAEWEQRCTEAGDLAAQRAVLDDGPEPWIDNRRKPEDDPFAVLLDCSGPSDRTDTAEGVGPPR